MTGPFRRGTVAVLTAAVGVVLFAVSQAGWAQDSGDDDVILKAMKDEMQRSSQLRAAGGQDAPYFFSYDLTDSENLRINASMVSTVSVSRDHLRFPSVEVRVGAYDFDNTNHLFSGIYSGSRY